MNKVAQRLLLRGVELNDAYLEVHTKLATEREGLRLFFDGLLNVSAFRSPKKLASARDARLKLDGLNAEISAKAGELAELLKTRSTLNGKDGFFCDTLCDVLEVMEVAARSNYLYQSYVSDHVRALGEQYDLNWPSLSEFAYALSVDAREAVIEASDPVIAIGTASKRASRVDFFRAWFKNIEEYREARHLPLNFELSDNAYASFANCVLDLGPNDLVDAGYVKRLRQRDREAPQRNYRQS